MKRNVTLANDRGYVFTKKIEGNPDLSAKKSYEIVHKEGEKKVTFKFSDAEATDKTLKLGNMVKNGYLQVTDYIGKSEVVAVVFHQNGDITVDLATDEDKLAFKKEQDAEREAKEAAKASGKGAKKESNQFIEKLLADGKIIKNDKKRYEFKETQAIKPEDTILALNKSGIFKVKTIDAEKGVVTATDQNQRNHYFSLKEVATK
jgi:hypothetical protein